MDLNDGFFNMKNNSKIIMFFPGLGSRTEYQNIGDSLLRCGNTEIEKIYREAAIAMGYGDQPEKMLINLENFPTVKMEKQGFIGASFITYNLALAAQLKEEAKQKKHSFYTVAYSGESFGIINAAISSGALSIGDGVKIANFFTPYILLSSDKQEDLFSQSIAAYYPLELKEQDLISETYYVIALREEIKS
uniref:Uncharacterized protein n=1 Tax=Acinetobacter larvae TaxID=1789224 RepID=A0A1J0RI34_9GAMM|nr:hypothetical protein [Acinetobacter larvae]APD77616.1 hypothetical protein BFG52_16555 [Acinetobacter larvae]